MHIRQYQPRDIDDVVGIFRSNIPKYFGAGEEPGLRDFLVKFPDDYFVAELDGEIIGAGGIALNDNDTVSLCWGMVRADHLGTGRGRQLTEFRIARAREKHGGLPLFISTSQLTRGFYERFGFRVTRHIPNGFGPGIDICEMLLEHNG
jgi:[ribosomal protein S18]-alanine N-acetyltransferase